MQLSARFKQYVSDFKKIRKKEKGIIIALLATLFVGSIFGSRFYFSRILTTYHLPASPAGGQPTTTPSPIPLPATLTLTSDKKTLKIGENVTVSIKINSPNQGVEAADFVLTFDPAYLKVTTLSAGNYFKTYPVQKSEEDFVKFTAVASLGNNKLLIPKGEGIIGTILFESQTATSATTVRFDKIKTIVASGGKNILDTTKITDLTISIE